MITATINLSALNRALANTVAALGAEAIAPALDEDVAAFFASKPVPVRTGRLRRAVAHPSKGSPDRRLVAGPFGVRVEVSVPYAEYQLRRVPRYQPVNLVANIARLVTRRLGGTP